MSWLRTQMFPPMPEQFTLLEKTSVVCVGPAPRSVTFEWLAKSTPAARLKVPAARSSLSPTRASSPRRTRRARIGISERDVEDVVAGDERARREGLPG